MNFDGKNCRLAIAKDIFEKKLYEQELQQSEERFHTAIENMLDCFSIYTAIRNEAGEIEDFLIEYVNEAACKDNSMTREEQVGKRLLDLFPSLRGAERFDEYCKLVETGESLVKEAYVRDAFSNEIQIYDARAVKLGDGFAMAWRDITGRKQAEEKIRKLNMDLIQRAVDLTSINKELESFCYSISHDLRAPLRAINGFSQMLIGEYYDKLDEIGKEHLQIISSECNRMSNLINDLLYLARFSRKEVEREEVDLSLMVENMAAELKMLEPERRADFVITPGIKADGDKLLLHSVLQNLLDNAWKFTSKHERARIEFGVTEQEDNKIYFVRDDGAGFDMKYADKLFGTFQRLHGTDEFPGNGIGLATTQRIIYRHGGRVWAEGDVEKGAAFYFTLT